MLFQIVSISDDFAPVFDDAGNLLTFEDGALAASAANVLTNKNGKKYQPRPVKQVGDEWKQREQARFDAGAYKHPLFVEREWFKEKAAEFADQFVHISIDKPNMIAFTESAEHGHADRQTRLKPAKYLVRYFPELSSRILNDEVAAHRAAFEDGVVLFANTAEEITEVYNEGPSSCMSHEIDSYCTGGIHPCSVYAGPDLAVAYMTNRYDSISARTVVWPDRKTYVGVYGDSTLAIKLEQMGYTEDGLDGARLTRIVHNGAFICPYIDGGDVVHDDGKYLVVGRGDRRRTYWGCQNTHGLVGSCWICESCNEQGDEDEAVTVHTSRHDTERWCSSCAEETVYDDNTGRSYDQSICTHIESADRYVPDWIVDREFFTSDYDQELYSNDQQCDVYVWKHGRMHTQTWTDDQAHEHATESDKSGEWYGEDSTVTLADGDVWGRDEFTIHGFECAACGDNYSCTQTHKEGPADQCDGCWDEKLAADDRAAQAVNDLRFACFVPLVTPLALPAPSLPLAAAPVSNLVLELQF